MTKRKKVFKFFTRTALVSALSIITVFIASVMVFINGVSSADIPESPNSIESESAITILASDGVTVISRLQPKDGTRIIVKPGRISVNMKNAIVSAEDRTFYDNFGFAPERIVKAALGHARGESGAGGGSTITQQLVKNILVGDEYSIERKWKEILSSTKLTASWNKDDIISSYLNTIYFGRGALGIESASQAYFGVHASELNKSQAALLAGIVQSPSNHDPAVNKKSAEDRFDYVTYQMHRNGYLDDQEYENISFPETLPPKPREVSTGIRDAKGHITSMALSELRKNGISEEKLYASGARIVTSIDINAQNGIEETSRRIAESNNVRVATVSTDPKTGSIRAIYGGDDGIGFNYATAENMTGSTFKVYTLAAALENGIGLNTPISSDPYPVGNVVINNSGGMTCGTCSISEATKQSLNTSFYRIQDMLPKGAETTREMARRLGVDARLSEENGAVNAGITLGVYGTTPVQMSNGFATIANNGIRNDSHIVDSVYTRNGKLFYKTDSHPMRVLSDPITNEIDKALEPIAAYSNNHQLAGKTGYMKTGTVQLGDTGQNRDAWVVGYTDNLSTAVWVGTDEGRPLVNAYGGMVWGAGLPADVWQEVMNNFG